MYFVSCNPTVINSISIIIFNDKSLQIYVIDNNINIALKN